MARRTTAVAAERVEDYALPWPAPWDNDRLVGHEDAERALLGALDSGRMAHAWLITGPRGIGKSTLAHRFARYLMAGEPAGGLFGKPDTLAVDSKQPAIQLMRSGAHPDFRRLERTAHPDTGRLRKEIAVDDVRDVGTFMRLTPAEGGWRIVVVDAADGMNLNAANALLKVLEEPPRRSVLLLVAHSPGRLLPTIRSRCRRLPLRPLTEAQVAALLASYLPDAQAAERQLAAGLSAGSIGQALSLVHAGCLDLYEKLMHLAGGLPGLDVPALHALADSVARREAETRYRMAFFLLDWWLKRLIRAAASGRFEAPLIAGERGVAERLVGAASLDRLIGTWEKIGDRFARADAVNLDRKQVTLGAFFALRDAMTS